MTPITNPAVARRFGSYPPAVRARLLSLRELILATAASIDAVGPLEETLKWGEPAYLTSASGSGTTIRIDWKAKSPTRYALYVNCKTTLVDTFRQRFPRDFAFDGTRALVLELSAPLPVAPLKFCIGAALTYHRKSGWRPAAPY